MYSKQRLSLLAAGVGSGLSDHVALDKHGLIVQVT